MRILKMWTGAGILVLAVAGLLWAGGVLPVADGSPQQVVAARKAMMQAIKLNLGDIGKKFEAGTLADIAANAASVEVMGRVMPPLYREKHESAYTGKGKYFTGAAPADFEAAAETFRAAAQKVNDGAAAGDKAAVAAGVGEVQASCGACHKAYRGAF
ncbi:MAG: cytochrome c [Desulfobacterales bacterium]|nr:cytochrome c [Desulfobacterales bacterium]